MYERLDLLTFDATGGFTIVAEPYGLSDFLVQYLHMNANGKKMFYPETGF